MVEHRYRVGVLVPQGNTVHAAEFNRMPHDQAEFRFEPFALPQPGAGDFCRTLVEAVRAPMPARRDWGVDAMLLGCTAASMSSEGTRWQAELERLASVPLVTAAGASRDAFAALGLQRLAVATPYGAASNAIVRAFLERSGIVVVALEGLGLDETAERWTAAAPTLTVERVLDYSLSVDTPEADGVYLPCAGMISVAVIHAYEQRTGKPATSSVQASYWSILATLDLSSSQGNSGRLLGDCVVSKPILA